MVSAGYHRGPTPGPGRQPRDTPAARRADPVPAATLDGMTLPHLLAAPTTAAVVDLTTGRAIPTAAALAGLVGVVLGALALRGSRLVGGRPGVVAGLVLAVAAAVVGALRTVWSAGGLGTGNGLAGAVVALVLGAVGTVLGGLALARSRRGAGSVARR